MGSRQSECVQDMLICPQPVLAIDCSIPEPVDVLSVADKHRERAVVHSHAFFGKGNRRIACHFGIWARYREGRGDFPTHFSHVDRSIP